MRQSRAAAGDAGGGAVGDVRRCGGAVEGGAFVDGGTCVDGELSLEGRPSPGRGPGPRSAAPRRRPAAAGCGRLRPTAACVAA